MNFMKRTRNSILNGLLALVLVAATLAVTAQLARACTVFVLTDSHRALFCNNEDWRVRHPDKTQHDFTAEALNALFVKYSVPQTADVATAASAILGPCPRFPRDAPRGPSA